MSIRSVGAVELHRSNFQSPANRAPHRASDEAMEQVPLASLQEEISNAAQEMADLLSAFGRFSKSGRKNDSADNDFVSSMLEDKADEKLGSLIKQAANIRNLGHFLNLARGFFPNDSDLMLALRELLLSRQLSELQKKKIKEAIKDLEKFGDSKKMQSGINVGRIARRFSDAEGDKSLSAKDLRSSYLRFLELDLPAGFIYQDWIDEYGYHNRQCLLAFTLSALVADMKANEPGIHFDEFGPLSAKLSDARVLHTLDHSLSENFFAFPFREQMRNQQEIVGEEQIVRLYMTGLIDFENFESMLKTFSHDYMSLLLIKQRATVIQTLRNIYNNTPGSLYADPAYRNIVLDFISALMTSLSEKEKNTGIWNEFYK
ncbi:type III secretion system gatekeeper subunit SctW [Pectobacterium carotovorum]|nr:type III secretion system gatekeeper subunit SctW [Pectobacterium carotovorum]